MSDTEPYGTMIRSNYTGMVLVRLRYVWVNLNDSVQRHPGELNMSEWTVTHRPAAVGPAPEPPEPEWEYGITWEPYVTGDGASPQIYDGCETESGAWATGHRLAGSAQVPKVWRRPVRPALRSVPVGPWEQTPEEARSSGPGRP